MVTDRTTVQQNIEKALKNGNFTFHSYDVTVCFFFSLFHHLMPHEDWRSKLEALSVQTFAYALTMVRTQLCWSTSIPHWTCIQIKYLLNQYKTGAIAKPVQEFSHSKYANDWQQLYNLFNQWSKKVDHITDWQ